MQVLPQALAPLGHFKQWVLWLGVPDPKRPGKTNKYPVNPQCQTVTAHDPANWLTFEQASQLLPGSGATGVGFVFTEHDPFFFVDIDDALDANGVWSKTATDLCAQFNGAAVEVSTSGKGLHIIGTAATIPHSCKNTPLGLELYTEGRFVALTGTGASGDAFLNCQNAFNNLVARLFVPREVALSVDWTEAPCDGWRGYDDDDELIRHAMKSGSAGSVFGTKASFGDLWTGNVDKLELAFPTSNDVDPWGRSEADAALASHLAFWTGRNCERIDSLFRASALMRDKWEREDYRINTILLACTGDGDVFTVTGGTDADLLPGVDAAALAGATPAPAPLQPAAPAPAPAGTHNGLTVLDYTVGSSPYERYVTSSELPMHFQGCVYVLEDHAILVPGGLLLDSGRFKAKYGGAVFCLDALGDKTTRNAWEAFTENILLRFPKVEETTFAPELPPGALVDRQGTKAVNTYWPVNVDRKPGDPSLFVNHIKKLLPQGDDAEILITYLAALVQNPGHKFQWCPIIQGPEGNGKTAIMECIMRAVGEKYCHLPNAQDLGGNGSKFTAWLQRKLFIGVEEIYCADRREVTEMLKPLITNRRIEIQAKGANQVTGDNRANWLMMTNHKDAVPVGIDSRRYCTLFCYQQTADELIAAGMGRDYYNTLYNWLRFADGFAIVSEFLHTYKCDPRFDPSEQGGIMRAPKTTSTNEAVKLSVGVIEQEVLEAAEQGRPGFCTPWVSSMALDLLLKEIRRTLPNSKRPEMLKLLGYVPHPGLLNGRVNNATATDGGKTRLYIKHDHELCDLFGAAEISNRYDADQRVLPSAAEKTFT